jgi:hypothetical protein
MLERITKRFTNKATSNVIENTKKTFNERIDEYGDIIEIGLVLSVIILGGHHFTKKSRRRSDPIDYGNPYNLPSGQPIIINNYYTSEREEFKPYVTRKKEEIKPRQTRQKR